MNNSNLFLSVTPNRIVLGGQSGIILNCGHEMTKYTFDNICNGKCNICNTDLELNEVTLLRLSLVDDNTDQTHRFLSITTESNGQTQIESDNLNIICPICTIPYNNEDTRIVVLPCQHVSCIKCLSHDIFQNKCYICRTEFFSDSIPYKFINPEETDFKEAINTNFEQFNGPLFHSGQIITQTPSEVIKIQRKYGKILNSKKFIWIFKNREATVVRLDPGLITVLHRWENISETFIEQTKSRRELSQLSARLSREASNRTYTQSVYDVDESDIIEEEQNSFYDFTPIIDGQNVNFLSPLSRTQINDVRDSIGALIGGRDNWLIGHVMSPGDPVMPNNIISINNNCPLIIRYVFQLGMMSRYYDLIKLFVKIENNRISDFILHTYAILNGLTNESVKLQRTAGLGNHTGDSTPFNSRNLIVHEFIHNNDDETTLKNFKESSRQYAELGYTHVIDVAAAWPHGSKLSEIHDCKPSIILYTTDENNMPIGYNIDPQIHHDSEAVIIGITSLITSEQDRSNYITLGWPTNGCASEGLQTISPIINTFNRILSTRPETLDLM